MEGDQQIKSLAIDQHYRYLGFSERLKTDSQTKSALTKEYFSCIKMILKNELSSLNTIDAINSYAVLALLYGFSVLDWNITELEKVDCKISDITHLYIPRKSGGRGIRSIVKN